MTPSGGSEFSDRRYLVLSGAFSLAALVLSYEYVVAEERSNTVVVLIGASLMLAVMVIGLTRRSRQRE